MAALVQRRFHELHDTNSRAYFLFVSSARWLGFRLDAICSVLLIAGTFAAVAAKHAAGGVLGGGDNPGLIGAALVFLVRLAGLFQWFVRQTAEFENQMVSVERLLAYARLPQEPPLASDAPPPAAWPQRGALVLKDVSMRYRPGLAPALRGVSFAVAPGSLVGVCGRTGAGKSSLLAALFRLSEPHEGAPAHAPRPSLEPRPVPLAFPGPLHSSSMVHSSSSQVPSRSTASTAPPSACTSCARASRSSCRRPSSSRAASPTTSRRSVRTPRPSCGRRLSVCRRPTPRAAHPCLVLRATSLSSVPPSAPRAAAPTRHGARGRTAAPARRRRRQPERGRAAAPLPGARCAAAANSG